MEATTSKLTFQQASSGSPGDVLDRLYAVIEDRRKADPAQSYVARRLSQGTAKIAQKVGEEAVETVVAAVAGKRRDLVAESADLLFHLLILWADAGVTPADVRAELERREGVSGVDEKLKRKLGADADGKGSGGRS